MPTIAVSGTEVASTPRVRRSSSRKAECGVVVISSWAGSASPPKLTATPATGTSGAAIRKRESPTSPEESRHAGEDDHHEDPEQPRAAKGGNCGQETRGLTGTRADVAAFHHAGGGASTCSRIASRPVHRLAWHYRGQPRAAVRALQQMCLHGGAGDGQRVTGRVVAQGPPSGASRMTWARSCHFLSHRGPGPLQS